MQLDEQQRRILRRLRKAPADFATLVKLAGLDPRQDFRGVSLRGVDFGRADVSDFDFTDADLSGADLRRATVGTALARAESLEGVRLPEMAPDEVLRPPLGHHQQMAFEAVMNRLDAGGKRALVCIPTGFGKTRVMAEIIEALRGRERLRRALILVDRRELADQYVRTLRELCPNLGVDQLRGREPRPESRVLVVQLNKGYIVDESMVSFIAGAMILPREFSHIFLDEAYGLPRTLVKAARESSTKMVGFTAMPTGRKGRRNQDAYGFFVNDVVFDYDLDRAVHDGYAAPIEIQDRSPLIDFPGLSDLTDAFLTGRSRELTDIFAEEIAARGGQREEARHFSTVLLLDRGDGAGEFAELMTKELERGRPRDRRRPQEVAIVAYERGVPIDGQGDVSPILVCETGQLDERLLWRCDRLVVLCRDLPDLVPEVWLSSVTPFRRSIIDYTGVSAEAFSRARQGATLGPAVVYERMRLSKLERLDRTGGVG